MYFKDKDNTNIDSEFNNDNILSHLIGFFSKYKLFIIIGFILILTIVMIPIFMNTKVVNYLVLNGDETIILYQDSDYIEPGYLAYNSKDEEISNEVLINSNLDTSKIGEYEINYTLGDIIKTRKIKVIEKPQTYTYIYLKTINNSVNIYLKLGAEYIEPGYKVFSSTGEDLTDKVLVSGSVDTSKKGVYKLIYTVIDSSGVTISNSRMVNVMDTEISLTLNTEDYTNENVFINVGIIDDYFDYMILPDGTEITENIYSYEVSENGSYTFKTYNKNGMEKEESIEVTNIDKTAPTGSCVVDQNKKGSFITITASDESGIKKYEYNGISYTNNIINLSSYIDNANVIIYDKANNRKEITCTIAPKVFIKDLNVDGVIVTVTAKKVNNEIAGYYFSYTNERPNKNSGGYLATNKESFDVVRLPGTTYVWVEDSVGKISEVQTIEISNDALLMTRNYKTLQNKKLATYLQEQGWSIEELNKLIARSVRAAGLYSKEAGATAGIALQTVLAQKYKIKLPYWWGGKSWELGADSAWGSYKYKAANDKEYLYYGLDCSGFVTWAYVNAGYNIAKEQYPPYWNYTKYEFNEKNGEIGDYLVGNGHIKMIVGKTETGFIIAEAGYGMIVDLHKYSQPNGYQIVKGESLMEKYDKMAENDIPSGF